MATRGAVAAYTLEVLLEILREKALFTDSDIEPTSIGSDAFKW